MKCLSLLVLMLTTSVVAMAGSHVSGSPGAAHPAATAAPLQAVCYSPMLVEMAVSAQIPVPNTACFAPPRANALGACEAARHADAGDFRIEAAPDLTCDTIAGRIDAEKYRRVRQDREDRDTKGQLQACRSQLNTILRATLEEVNRSMARLSALHHAQGK